MNKLSEIFDIWYGVNLEVVNCTETIDSWIPFVSRTSENNGVATYVEKMDDVEPNPAFTLSIAGSGSVLSTFFHDYEYYSGRDLYIAKPKVRLSKQEMLYYCTIIEANKYRYSYGRQANKTLKDILVPSLEEIPQSVKSHKIDGVFEETPLSNRKLTLDTKSWKWFYYADIFDIKIWKSIDLNKLEQGIGGVNYVARTEDNNGITAQVIDDGAFEIYKWNCLTVPMVWNELKASYQTESFCVSQNIAIFRPKDLPLNRYTWVFLNTLIRKDVFRFAYGRTLSLERLKMLKIKLPITPIWSPDWQWMEDYIKGLPYSANL